MFRAIPFVLSALLLAACSNGGGAAPAFLGVTQMVGQAGGVVTSSDGRLTLEIPPGALGNDTPITIRAMTQAELGPEFQGVDVEAAYELGPDGLQFRGPVRVTLDLRTPASLPDGTLHTSIVVMLTESGGLIEAAADQEQRANADLDETTLSGTIQHFTKLVVVKAHVAVEVDSVPDSILAGQTFDTRITITTNEMSRIDGIPQVCAKPTGSLKLDGEHEPSIPFESRFQPRTAQVVVIDQRPYRCNGRGRGLYKLLVRDGGEFRYVLSDKGEATAASDFLVLSRFGVLFEKTVMHVAGPPPAAVIDTGEKPEGVAVGKGEVALRLVGGEYVIFVCTVIGIDIIDPNGRELIGRVPIGKTFRVVALHDEATNSCAIAAVGTEGCHIMCIEADGTLGTPTLYPVGRCIDVSLNEGSKSKGLVTNNAENKVYPFGPGAGGFFLDLTNDLGTIPDPYTAVSACRAENGNTYILGRAEDDTGKLFQLSPGGEPEPLFDVDTGLQVRSCGDLVTTLSHGTPFGGGGFLGAAQCQNGTLIQRGGIAVAGGVSMELCKSDRDTVLIATAASRTDEGVLAEATGENGIISFDFSPLPPGCSGAAHAAWLDVDTLTVVTSCGTTNNLAIFSYGTSE